MGKEIKLYLFENETIQKIKEIVQKDYYSWEEESARFLDIRRWKQKISIISIYQNKLIENIREKNLINMTTKTIRHVGRNLMTEV